MDNINIEKTTIIEACILHLNQTATHIETEIKDIQQQANDYGQPKDRYDSFRNKLMRTKDIYSKQLATTLENIKIISQFQPNKKYTTVDYGAVVITNKQNILIATGIGKFRVQNQPFFAISANAPLFAAMKGKKQGDEFTFNAVKQKILKVL